MAEDAPPMTLQQRIAALNSAHMGRLPTDAAPTIRPKPQLPDHRPPIVKHNSANIPYEQVNGTVTDSRVGNKPSGPPQLPARKQPPPLPSRNGVEPAPRSPSISSTVSTAASDNGSRKSSLSRTISDEKRVKAPAWGDPRLPVLPPKTRPERPQATSRKSSYGQIGVSGVKNAYANTRQALPPPLPGRQSSLDSQTSANEQSARKLPPMPTASSIEQARRAAFTTKVSSDPPEQPVKQQVLPPKPVRPSVSESMVDSKPPPIPHASRPDLSAIQATKPQFVPQTSAAVQPVSHRNTSECMICRDFSGPDNHAARFPRQQVGSLSDLGYQLTAPFPSLTDKARAIFTWLHHNIAYDVEAFFNDRVKGSTPQSTLQSGLAVCEGYAALFTNIANHAGLESVVISGDGKGFGYTAWTPSQPIPPFSSNHAWNAVKIDGGEWKLIDTCWGAGYVQGKGKPYVPKFNPAHFTMSNEEFGTKHYPTNKNQLFLPGGRTLSWEQYVQINPDRWPFDCDLPTLFSNAPEDYAIGQRTLMPRERRIRVQTPGTIRFSFGLFCEHWTLERQNKGQPPVFVLGVHGVDGRKDDFVPLERVKGTTPGGGGDMWYVDIPPRELGAPGQTLTLYAIMTFGDRQNARGLSVREFLQGKGKLGMSFSGIAAWDLV